MYIPRTAFIAGCLVTGACTVGSGSGSGENPADSEQVIGSSAGGQTNIISDAWEVETVPHGNNLKMLNFVQMQSEVLRATSITSKEWAGLRTAFGAPDFVNSYEEDRTPTATKILTWRKLAFSVCGSMITNETATPALFTSITPTAAISASDSRVTEQVTAVFTKFFQDPPTADEVALSTKMLTDVVAGGGKPGEAWTGLCVAYISSMRFLTY